MLKTFLVYFLRLLAKKIIKKYNPDVIGITGSVGKTSAKESVTAVLGSKFNVRSNYKNYNNEIGLPLTVIGFDKSPGHSFFGWLNVFLKAVELLCVRDANYPEILVLEMGADKPGDIKYLTEIAPCKVGVLTAISHAHTEYFKTLKKITQEKRVIISHLKNDGFAVLNFDYDLIMENKEKTSAEVLTYGFKEGADLRASDVNMILDDTGAPLGLNFKVSYKGNIVPAFLPGVVAEHLIYAPLAGMAVGIVMGINLVEAIEAIKNIKPLAGHMRILTGVKNSLIIDDTYNSSPEATISALATLSKINIKDSARRYAVLADMLELGGETENAHKEVGEKVAKSAVDFLITVGEASKLTAEVAIKNGLPEDCIAKFSNAYEAGKFLQEKIKEGDLILIKGSQSMRMEKVVKEIMAEPLKAKEFLVRQGSEWQN